MNILQRLGLPFWSILIAIVLWIQVHGQGMGSVRMDVALQVRDVPVDMVIVNDLPDQVSITISGLQTQLNTLESKDLFVSVDASTLNMPGVIEQALDIEAIDLPVGLKVEKIQPDSVQLQVDHIVKRTLEVTPIFDLPQGWRAEYVVITPSSIDLTGPEVWLSALDKVETSALRLDLKQGLFDVGTSVVPLSGKGIHSSKKDLTIRVRGELFWTPTVQQDVGMLTDDISGAKGDEAVNEKVSIVPVLVDAIEKRETKNAKQPIIKPADTSIREPSPQSIVPVPEEVYSNAKNEDVGIVEPYSSEIKSEVIQDSYSNKKKVEESIDPYSSGKSNETK